MFGSPCRRSLECILNGQSVMHANPSKISIHGVCNDGDLKLADGQVVSFAEAGIVSFISIDLVIAIVVVSGGN